MTIRVTISRRILRITIPRSVPASVKTWLNSLPEYASDQEAEADGVILGGWYMMAANHNEGPGGVPRKRLV